MKLLDILIYFYFIEISERLYPFKPNAVKRLTIFETRIKGV